MKAMQLKTVNAPLEMTELPKPVPKKDQVLVRVRASGVNPLDIKIRQGQAGHAQVQAPAILGIDMAGTVEELGENVTDFQLGDDVYGMVGGVGANQGTLAEYICADVHLIALKPKNLSMREAAAIPLIFITAWEGLVDRAGVEKGANVLILGGAGGVGHMAVQIARAMGGNVSATGGTSSMGYLESIGAKPFDYMSAQTQPALAALAQSPSFDVIYDTVGGKSLDQAFSLVRHYVGHVVSCLGWGAHALAPLSFKGATYSGVFTLYPLLSGNGRKHHGEILKEATALIEAGKVVPKMAKKKFQLAEVNEAHLLVESGRADGKVIVEI